MHNGTRNCVGKTSAAGGGTGGQCNQFVLIRRLVVSIDMNNRGIGCVAQTVCLVTGSRKER